MKFYSLQIIYLTEPVNLITFESIEYTNYPNILTCMFGTKYNLKQNSVCYTNFVICEDDKVPFRTNLSWKALILSDIYL